MPDWLASVWDCLFTPLQIAEDSKLLQNKKIALQNDESIQWESWSPQAMEKYQLTKQMVFIDFTAQWCLTCKVNDRLVLNTVAFTALAQQFELKLLLADWTNRDPVIGEWLKNHGLVGVPAYFIQKADGKLISLGETISIQEIHQVLSAP